MLPISLKLTMTMLLFGKFIEAQDDWSKLLGDGI